MLLCRALLIAGLSLLFIGCSSINPISGGAAPQVLAEGPETWRAQGRFAYADEEDRQNGQFDWRQRGSNYQVRLFGPLGMGSVSIIGSADKVEIQSGEQSYFSTQPDLLFFELTGMHIPIAELSLWMTGKVREENQTGEWQILFDQYQEVGEFQLPSRIDLENSQSSMRIAVSEWSLDLD